MIKAETMCCSDKDRSGFSVANASRRALLSHLQHSTDRIRPHFSLPHISNPLGGTATNLFFLFFFTEI